MATKSKLKIGDLSSGAILIREGSIVLMPVGGVSATETNKTAEPTTITGDKVQKDRGIEFDYPKPKTPKAAARKSSKK